MTKSPNPIDKHVGARLRMRRMLVGMSQEKLGQAVGITFQQVQKYEKGTNRVSASRMHQIGQVLGVPVEFFYEGASALGSGQAGFAESPGASYQAENLLSTSEGIQLMRAFTRIADSRVRRKIVDLAEALAEADGKSA
ncbi:MAG TPA: helix-turn-helix transcriptional regulator [Beijerinckiaceae bacterium]|jgi:transcriptional regulator with XRE-family HTH domain